MSTFIFLWNPNNFAWDDFDQKLNEFQKKASLIIPWSCYAHSLLAHSLVNGERPGAIPFRSGGEKENRGIIGWGEIVDPPFESPNYEPTKMALGQTRWYASLCLKSISKYPIISRSTLRENNTLLRLPMSSGNILKSDDEQKIWKMLEIIDDRSRLLLRGIAQSRISDHHPDVNKLDMRVVTDDATVSNNFLKDISEAPHGQVVHASLNEPFEMERKISHEDISQESIPKNNLILNVDLIMTGIIHNPNVNNDELVSEQEDYTRMALNFNIAKYNDLGCHFRDIDGGAC
jgi:hypothetical protein